MAKSVKLQEVAIDLLKPYERNAKMHPQEQVEKLVASIKEFGFVTPCVIDEEYNLIAGHGRVQAAKEMGLEAVPCVFVEGLTEAQRRAFILADNRLGELGEWDMELVIDELQELEDMDFDIDLTGFELKSNIFLDIEYDKRNEAQGSLKERYIVTPFSVLDSRAGDWQKRKRAWKDLGIDSVKGRGNDGDGTTQGLIYANSHVPPEVYKKKNAVEEKLGREITWDEYYEYFPNDNTLGGTSIFDPVLTELMCRWYSKEGDRIIDPFAGGSVRGIVSALLGREYTGIDLSERQILANRENWEQIDHKTITDRSEATEPKWIVGDSLQIDKLVKEDEFDMLLTCPPYADLEVYSDDPRDISNMDYEDFCKVYSEIIKKSARKLKDNSFAAVIIGSVRDKQGNYRDLVAFTIKSFVEAGMHLYNDGILVTSSGAAAVALSRQFNASRKAGKIHQNILVFVKGDAKKRTEELGEVETGDFLDYEEE